LQTALDTADQDIPHDKVISYKMLQEARTCLGHFEKVLANYKQTLRQQVSENKKYRETVKTAHLYVSHFIQVLNFAVLRGEIKQEHKAFYKLKEDSFALPDLSTEKALHRWGKNIIEGEQLRRQNGGSAMYNPTIANVQVHFDIFDRQYNLNKINKDNTLRYVNGMTPHREKADGILLDIWNQVEEKFLHLPWYERIEQCGRYGVIYYYRRGEEKPVETEVISFLE
jgi:hypothetical protein